MNLTLASQGADTGQQGSRKSKICWELTKSSFHVQSSELKKNICSVKLIIPITRVLCIFFRVLVQFGWKPLFLLAHFGWWTLISETISTD